MGFSGETQIRVRYGETDKMGVVYYGNYPLYFEVGRTELMRKFGLTYKHIEESNIVLPVVSLNIKYHKPARYDDLLTIRTSIREIPSAKITFDYQILNETGELVAEGDTVLVFTDATTRKPRRAPAGFVSDLQKYF